MCLFCAAVPAAAAAGAALNNDRTQKRRAAEAIPEDGKPDTVILKITAGVVALLLAGSVTYHTLVFRP